MPKRNLPYSAAELASSSEVAKLIAERFHNGKSCSLMRYGDTSGRLIARPDLGTSEYEYLKSFLGLSVTPEQVDFLAGCVERSIVSADVIGLRSDLLGQDISAHILHAPDDAIRRRLVATYPIREFERTRLGPDDARRLAQTRKAMEAFVLPEGALLTDAWVHVSLAEAGFLSALMFDASSFALVTSADRRAVVERIADALPNRMRYFECPCYPKAERKWGGDHAFLWQRWMSLADAIVPSYPGEPMIISAGIWTKVIGPIWASRGGIALDVGSVMDYLDRAATRPAVLATRYGDARTVPDTLSLEAQLQSVKPLANFLI